MKTKPSQAKAKTKKKQKQIDVNSIIGNKYRRCLICGQQYGKKNLSSHIHSYVHHEAIEHIKGSKQLHKCLACKVSVMGLEMYKEHISTHEHTHGLFLLHNKGKQMQLREDYNIHLTKNEFRALKIQQQKKEQQKDCGTCFVCCKSFPAQDIDVHMHSCLHHQMIEQLKGSPQVHKCRACELSYAGLAEFSIHVQTIQHQYMMFKLKKNTADGQIVDYSADMDDELRNHCVQRDQLQMKNMEKRKCPGKGAQAKNTNNSIYWSTPVVNGKYTNEHNRNGHSASMQLNQILPKWRQDMPDMDNSNGPLVKPSEHHPQEVSAHTTHPNPKKNEGDVYEVTLETEGGASVEPTCSPALGQSRVDANRYKLITTARQNCTNQKETTGHEAVVLQYPQGKAIKAVFQPMTRKDTNEPYADSLPSVSSLPETTLEGQISKNDSQVLETAENVRPHAVHVKRKKSNEREKEHTETSPENHNIQTTKKRKQDTSHNDLNPERNGKMSKKGNVNKLLALSLKEDELTRSLENVGDQLIRAYSILQITYTEVQRLLAVKQQVTSEMASLRENRIKILQQMKNTC